jgi:hypothetical protein
MADPIRLLTLFLGAFGTVMMLCLTFLILRKGELERRVPLHPFTRAENPKIFWAFVLAMLMGTAMCGWGTVVMFLRLIRP